MAEDYYRERCSVLTDELFALDRALVKERAESARLRSEVEAAKVVRDGAIDRAKICLGAKNAAMDEVRALRERIRDLAAKEIRLSREALEIARDEGTLGWETAALDHEKRAEAILAILGSPDAVRTTEEGA